MQDEQMEEKKRKRTKKQQKEDKAWRIMKRLEEAWNSTGKRSWHNKAKKGVEIDSNKERNEKWKENIWEKGKIQQRMRNGCPLPWQALGSALEERMASHFRDLQSTLEFVESNIKFVESNIKFMLLAVLTFSPESSATLRLEDFRQNTIHYQGSSACCVLSQRFPESYRKYLQWGKGPRFWSC